MARAKKPLKSTNHLQKPNDVYHNQTAQPNDAKEQTQYDNPAHEHEQTNEPYPKSRFGLCKRLKLRSNILNIDAEARVPEPGLNRQGQKNQKPKTRGRT